MNLSKIGVTAVVAVMLPGLWSCGGNKEQTAPISRPNVYVVVPQSSGDVTTSVHTSTVEEGKSVNAGFKTGGQITRLTAKEGDYVKKGQVIGYIEDADYRLGVNQLETQYGQVSSELRRLEEMYRRNNLAPNDYEKAKAGLKQLEIQLELAKNKLSYTRLVAPVSGYVVSRMMEEGEMAGAGTPVYKILDNSSLEAAVALPASVYSRRHDIAKCEGVSSATGDSRIPLEVINFIPDADNNSLFHLRLRIPDSYREQLMPGMNMSVSLSFRAGGEGGQYLVPSRSLFERGGKRYVWTVNMADSTLAAREINVIGTHSGEMSAVTGLSGSDAVVAAGVHHLTDRQKVNIIGDISELKEHVGL